MELKLLRPILLATSLFLLFNLKLNAQINMPYNIGAFGMSNANITTFAGAVSIEGYDCVVVKSGLQNFLTKKDGQFSNTCLINLPMNGELQFATFPNPANNYFIIKSVNYLDEKSANQYQIDLKNVLGQNVVKFNTSNAGLNAGIKLNISSIPTGEYIVQIQSQNAQPTFLKMLKVN